MTGTHELFYLAQPYWSDDAITRSNRTNAAYAALAYLGRHNIRVFSPIAHWAMAKALMPRAVYGDHNFWLSHDLPLLVRCDAMLILPLDGWQQSRGVRTELTWARTHSISVLQLVGDIPHLHMHLYPTDEHPHVVCSQFSPQFPLISEIPHHGA